MTLFNIYFYFIILFFYAVAKRAWEIHKWLENFVVEGLVREIVPWTKVWELTYSQGLT